MKIRKKNSRLNLKTILRIVLIVAFIVTSSPIDLAATKYDVEIAEAYQSSSSIITPEKFGALGDGITDDTKAIQAAVDAAGDYGTVLLSEKTYVITKPIILKSNIYFRGSSRYTVLEVTMNDSAIILGTKKVENLVISDLTINCSVVGPLNHYGFINSDGIELSNITISNVKISAPSMGRNGIFIKANLAKHINDILIVNSEFANIGRMGVEIIAFSGSDIHARNIEVRDCHFDNVGKVDIGIALSIVGAVENVNIHHNTFKDNPYAQIETGGKAYNYSIHHNSFLGKSENLIMNNGLNEKITDNLKIYKNLSNKAATGRIYIRAAQNSSINDNEFYLNHIEIGKYSSNIKVFNNVIRAKSKYAIFIDSAKDNQVYNNYFESLNASMSVFFRAYSEGANNNTINNNDLLLTGIEVAEQISGASNNVFKDNKFIEDIAMYYERMKQLDQETDKSVASKIINKEFEDLEELKRYEEDIKTHTLESYEDISSQAWYLNELSNLIALGVISGYKDETFKPDNNIKVDEFIKLVLTTLDYDIENAEAYWAQNYIEKAIQLNLITSTKKDDYTRNITRGEMALIVVKALNLSYEEDMKSAEESIKDFSEIKDELKKGIAMAHAYGIMSGYKDGNFKTDNYSTRAEATTIIYRMLVEREQKIFKN